MKKAFTVLPSRPATGPGLVPLLRADSFVSIELRPSGHACSTRR